jgi:DNA invertase Pin-like site-specific DNA recombinase
MAEIGYPRVSTVDQDPALPPDALAKAGRFRTSRPAARSTVLIAALAFVREGDVLVVLKLDRLGRSLLH